jgi:antitoxin ParD1/3/4
MPCPQRAHAKHINLSPEMEQYLRGKVSAGFYSNASEVVRHAIRRMGEEDEKLAALRAAVAIGDEQLAVARGRPTARSSWRSSPSRPWPTPARGGK